MGPEVTRIVRLLEKTYNGQPWYGSSILAVLEGLSQEEADNRVSSGHTIHELLLHMIAWRTFATRRLTGDDDFDIDDSTNFPTPGKLTETLRQLAEAQDTLVGAAKSFPEERLSDLVPSKRHRYTYYTLLHGIIQHDIYHLGQLALLRKVKSL